MLTNWLAAELEGLGLPTVFDLLPASSDASFRRYFRVIPRHRNISYIVMDAPPDHEDCRPFVAIARAMAAIGLNVPQVISANLDMGFLLLTDLGDRQYLSGLNEDTVQSLYDSALASLLVLQKSSPPAGLLPGYSRELLLAEMQLFDDWFVSAFLGLQLQPLAREMLDEVFQLLADLALAQPQVWVHRDYHSRNLMIVAEQDAVSSQSGVAIQAPGILDFQDAVMGPICYDLVSLLRDCYISWPVEQVNRWVDNYYDQLVALGILPSATGRSEFRRWFDLMGVQRHLKAIGIFARLKLRDNKPDYIAHIPRTLFYIIQVAGTYPELAALLSWLERDVLSPLRSGLGLAEDYFHC